MSRIESTEEAYLKRAIGRLESFSLESGVDWDVQHDAFLSWLRSYRSRVAKAPWRNVRAALVWYMNTYHPEHGLGPVIADISVDDCKAKADATSADFQFHFLIAQATGNKHYTDILSHLGTNLIPKTRIETDRVNREHEDIFAAIARGDSEAARAAMRLHLSNSRERFRKLNAEQLSQ